MPDKEIVKAFATVRHKDARLLREALANIFHKAPPLIKQKIHDTLLAYAEAVKPYCKCLDRSWVPKEKNRFACLDCGTRYADATSTDKIPMPPQRKINFVQPGPTQRFVNKTPLAKLKALLGGKN